MECLFRKFPTLNQAQYTELQNMPENDDARCAANASWCSHIETSTKCSLYSTAYYSLCYQLTVDALLQEKQQNIPRRYDKTDIQDVKPSASDILYTETILDLVWKGYGPAKNGGKDVELTYKRLIEEQTVQWMCIRIVINK